MCIIPVLKLILPLSFAGSAVTIYLEKEF